MRADALDTSVMKRLILQSGNARNSFGFATADAGSGAELRVDPSAEGEQPKALQFTHQNESQSMLKRLADDGR